MSSDIRVSIEGLAWKMLQHIADIGEQELHRVLERAMSYWVFGVIDKIPPYPPQQPQVYKPSQYWTDKQRRYFWWALREGIITLPYKRRHSAGIAGAISGQIWEDGGAVHGSVGVNQSFDDAGNPDTVGGLKRGKTGGRGYAPYAKYVIGDDDEQAWYHKGHWWQFEDEVHKVAEDAGKRAAINAVKEFVQRNFTF
jgi:hypothetical protein